MSQSAPRGFEGTTFICDTGVICIYCPPDSTVLPNTGFETAVRQVLINIRTRQSGKIVTDSVAGAPLPTFIVPQMPDSGPGTVAWSIQKATFRNEPLRTCNQGGMGQVAGAVIPGGGIGTGEGSAVAICFTPGRNRGGFEPGSSQDEILLHELVHAHRKLSGRQSCRPVAHDMDTIEELFSVAITNIYASQYGRKLRRNHRSFQELTDPAGWVKLFQNELRDLAFEEEILVNLLRTRIAGGFRPFR